MARQEHSANPQSDTGNSQPKPRRDRQLTSTQVMFAVILAIGLMLAINFSNRISADRDLQAIREKVLQEIELLRREQSDLIAELAFTRSDAYVESWARSQGRMVREGEILFRLFPAELTAEEVEQAQTPLVAEVQTTLPQPEPWQLWWGLFFDSEPPQAG